MGPGVPGAVPTGTRPLKLMKGDAGRADERSTSDLLTGTMEQTVTDLIHAQLTRAHCHRELTHTVLLIYYKINWLTHKQSLIFYSYKYVN